MASVIRTPLRAYPRIGYQQVQRAGGQVPGGLVAGDHQQQPELAELPIAEALAVHLGGRQQADQVVLWRGPALRGHAERVAERLDERLPVRVHVAAAVLGVVEAHQVVAPPVEQVTILLGQAEQLRQHQQGQLGGQLGDHVELVPLPYRRHQPARVRGDAVGQPADRARREDRGDHLADPGVLRCVHVGQQLAHEIQIGGCARIVEEGPLGRRGEDLGLPGHRDDRVVRGDRPVPASPLLDPAGRTVPPQRRLGNPTHRLYAPPPGELLMRNGLAVGRRMGDVCRMCDVCQMCDVRPIGHFDGPRREGQGHVGSPICWPPVASQSERRRSLRILPVDSRGSAGTAW